MAVTGRLHIEPRVQGGSSSSVGWQLEYCGVSAAPKLFAPVADFCLEFGVFRGVELAAKLLLRACWIAGYRVTWVGFT